MKERAQHPGCFSIPSARNVFALKEATGVEARVSRKVFTALSHVMLLSGDLSYDPFARCHCEDSNRLGCITYAFGIL